MPLNSLSTVVSAGRVSSRRAGRSDEKSDGGLIGAETADAGPRPVALRAATVKRYPVPLWRPVMVAAGVPSGVSTGVCATPLTKGVMRYPVTGPPPVNAGATQVSATEAGPGVPATLVGGPGRFAGPQE